MKLLENAIVLPFPWGHLGIFLISLPLGYLMWRQGVTSSLTLSIIAQYLGLFSFLVLFSTIIVATRSGYESIVDLLYPAALVAFLMIVTSLVLIFATDNQSMNSLASIALFMFGLPLFTGFFLLFIWIPVRLFS